MRSKWFFPALLTLALIVLSLLKISGSSIGVYHSFFYGNTKDPNLIAGHARNIRSDEWIVTSQVTIAQSTNDYKPVNENLGSGEDVTLLADAPYKEWSAIFKPHNAGFFVLPFDIAFALRWWLISYLLVLSCYFFVLMVLPGRRLIAALLSVGFLFSPFLQWWYTYGTLASIYYCLFGILIINEIFRAKSILRVGLWGVALAYIGTCFALVLYPPFQIACAMVSAVFVLTYFPSKYRGKNLEYIWQKLAIITCAGILAIGCTGLFIITRRETVQAIQNSAYPGHRIEKSGTFSSRHFLSSHLSAQHIREGRAAKYVIPEKGLVNQSVNSNFILLVPFILIPAVYLLYDSRKKKHEIDWALLGMTLVFLFMLAWMFVPGLGVIGSITLLNKVPTSRLLIGFGLLNLMYIVLFIRRLEGYGKQVFSNSLAIVYSILVFVTCVFLGVRAAQLFPGFIGTPKSILLSLPMGVMTYLLLRGYYKLFALGFATFCIFSSISVQPLYRSTDVLRKTPLMQAVQEVSKTNPGKWATDESSLENFAFMSGSPSMSGVYLYPQLNVWQQSGANPDIYNRYAHTNFVFDRQPDHTVDTNLKLVGEDNFGIFTEPCSAFVKSSNIKFIITQVEFSPNEACTQLVKEVTYPSKRFYIYKTVY